MNRAEVERWVEQIDTSNGTRTVVHVVHHHAPERRSGWAAATAEGRVLAVGGLALGVFMLLALFALAGGGGGGTALLVGIILGVLSAALLAVWMAARWG